MGVNGVNRHRASAPHEDYRRQNEADRDRHKDNEAMDFVSVKQERSR